MTALTALELTPIAIVLALAWQQAWGRPSTSRAVTRIVQDACRGLAAGVEPEGIAAEIVERLRVLGSPRPVTLPTKEPP